MGRYYCFDCGRVGCDGACLPQLSACVCGSTCIEEEETVADGANEDVLYFQCMTCGVRGPSQRSNYGAPYAAALAWNTFIVNGALTRKVDTVTESTD